MRGVVFTELIEFVEDVLGFETADKMIEDAKLNNNGVFTQGGNYPFSDTYCKIHHIPPQQHRTQLTHLFVRSDNVATAYPSSSDYNNNGPVCCSNLECWTQSHMPPPMMPPTIPLQQHNHNSNEDQFYQHQHHVGTTAHELLYEPTVSQRRLYGKTRHPNLPPPNGYLSEASFPCTRTSIRYDRSND